MRKSDPTGNKSSVENQLRSGQGLTQRFLLSCSSVNPPGHLCKSSWGHSHDREQPRNLVQLATMTISRTDRVLSILHGCRPGSDVRIPVVGSVPSPRRDPDVTLELGQ